MNIVQHFDIQYDRGGLGPLLCDGKTLALAEHLDAQFPLDVLQTADEVFQILILRGIQPLPDPFPVFVHPVIGTGAGRIRAVGVGYPRHRIRRTVLAQQGEINI